MAKQSSQDSELSGQGEPGHPPLPPEESRQARAMYTDGGFGWLAGVSGNTTAERLSNVPQSDGATAIPLPPKYEGPNHPKNRSRGVEEGQYDPRKSPAYAPVPGLSTLIRDAVRKAASKQNDGATLVPPDDGATLVPKPKKPPVLD